MPLLNAADAMFFGGSEVSKVYQGSNLIYQTGGGPGPDPGGPPVTTLVRSVNNFAVQPASSISLSLPAAPAANALVLGVVSINKSSTAHQVTGLTLRRAHAGIGEVSGIVASGAGVQSGSFSWTNGGAGGCYGALFEFNHTNWAFRNAVTSPASDTAVGSISLDTLGAAPVPGVVFAIAGVDSSWGASGPFNDSATITWGNGFTPVGLGRYQQAASASGDAGGSSFIIAKKDVDTGDPTGATVSWSGGTDGAYMTLIQFDVS